MTSSNKRGQTQFDTPKKEQKPNDFGDSLESNLKYLHILLAVSIQSGKEQRYPIYFTLDGATSSVEIILSPGTITAVTQVLPSIRASLPYDKSVPSSPSARDCCRRQEHYNGIVEGVNLLRRMLETIRHDFSSSSRLPFSRSYPCSGTPVPCSSMRQE